MSQTASGFLRVALLVIATSALALVWTGDQQAQQQFIAARKAAGDQEPNIQLARNSSAATAVDETVSSNRRTSHLRRHSHSAGIGTASHRSQRTSYVARVEIEMSLPVGIASGRYQVVDQSGSVQTITIPATPGCREAKDVYTLTRRDGSRRFFIRLNEQTASAGGALSR